jgi:hypothetical protein
MGKTIKIYLANESVSGIRHAEIANWSGQALACPRSRFHELRQWPEVQRPGVYFLFGIDDQTGEEAAYIGEAEVVIDRLASHMSGKDFWAEVVTFTSKDENLTKAHVRYLESRLITTVKQAGRYRLTNASTSQLPSLPRSDRDAMEEFLGSVQMLLGVLGHKVLEPLVTAPPVLVGSSILIGDLATAPQETKMSALHYPVSSDLAAFRLHVADLTAYAIRTDEGIVVLSESEASLTSRASLTGGLLGARLALIESGILVEVGSKHKFVKNHLFRSPSQAAAVIVGYSINGRESWRLPDGTTWGKYEQNLSLTSDSTAPP